MAFSTKDTEGIPLVDVANAFNNLNRKAALYNMNFICPTLATILTNSYQSPNRMFISVRGEVLSSEGTTQGDPLGMVMYALAVIPLINKLQELHVSTSQVWFADDATAGSTCQRQFGCTQSIFWLLPQSFQNLLGCEGRAKFDRQSTQAEAIFNQLPLPPQQ